MNETHPRFARPTTRKRTLLNLSTLVPQSRSAEGLNRQMNSDSLIPSQANNNRLAHTLSQIRPQALPRPYVKQQNGTQPKSVEFRKKRTPLNYRINQTILHINSQPADPVGQPLCTPPLTGTLGIRNWIKPSRDELSRVEGPTYSRRPTNCHLQSEVDLSTILMPPPPSGNTVAIYRYDSKANQT